MSRMLAPLLTVFALAAAPLGQAHAQAPRFAYGEPHPHHAPAERASDAAARAAAIARRETGESPIAHELYRLSNLLRRAEERHGRHRGHGRGRGRGGIDARIIHQVEHVHDAFDAYPGRPSLPLRRAMQELEAVLAQQGYSPDFHAPPPEPRPYPMPAEPPYPHHPAPQGAFRFEGSFEGMPIVFEGPSPESLFDRCRAWLAASRMSGADDITVFGAAARNVHSYWSLDALCAISVLNARPTAMHVAVAPVEGRVESVPFCVAAAPYAGAERMLRRFLPIALQGENVDEVTVAGRSFRNGPGFWSVDEAVQIVLSYREGRPPYATALRSAFYVR